MSAVSFFTCHFGCSAAIPDTGEDLEEQAHLEHKHAFCLAWVAHHNDALMNLKCTDEPQMCVFLDKFAGSICCMDERNTGTQHGVQMEETLS
jgi:hypothetical protein